MEITNKNGNGKHASVLQLPPELAEATRAEAVAKTKTEKPRVEKRTVKTRTADVRMEVHESIVAQYASIANAVKAEDVRTPWMPVATFAAEVNAMNAVVRREIARFQACGLSTEIVDTLDGALKGLVSSQVLQNVKRQAGRSPELQRMIEEAITLRVGVVRAGALALRKDEASLGKLTAIGQAGDTPSALVGALLELGALLDETRAAFTAIGVDVEPLMAQAGELSAGIDDRLSQEMAQRVYSNTKDMRDRFFTAAVLALAELRAYAAFVFRDDPRLRSVFVSTYVKQRNQRAARRRADEKEEEPKVAV